MRKLMAAAIAMAALTIFGCGGGGGAAAPSGPTSAVLRISSVGTLAPGTSLSGITVTVNLPTGVSVANTGGVGNTGVVTASGIVSAGTATVSPVLYTAASGGTPAKVTFTVASTVAGGFGVGEFATLNCVIASGNTPLPTDFSIASMNPSDMTLTPVAGLTPAFSAVIQ